jgi:DNA-directed RNA polymerase specialized sigma24 family protein
MLNARLIAKQETLTYPMATDFCRIFEQNMSGLYLLAFLLTADQDIAEECFSRALEDAARSNRVFKEWAEAWARRMIVQSAIQMIQPQPTDSDTPVSGFGRSNGQNATSPELAALVELSAFERFAFVMSVLERYSDQECSVLLGRTRGEVAEARVRALRQLGSSAELHRKQIISGSIEQIRNVGESALQPESLSRVAASA